MFAIDDIIHSLLVAIFCHFMKICLIVRNATLMYCMQFTNDLKACLFFVMKLCKMPNLMGWDLQYIIDQNQDALRIEALPFGAGRICSCTIMDEKRSVQ